MTEATRLLSNEAEVSSKHQTADNAVAQEWTDYNTPLQIHVLIFTTWQLTFPYVRSEVLTAVTIKNGVF
jgi:hypothetical protein